MMMSRSERVNDLLDAWEELVSNDPQADVQAFLVQSCGHDEPAVIEEVRNKIAALRAMDRLLPGSRDKELLNIDSPPVLPGERREPIPGYRLLHRIAAGGFGEVWRASGPLDFPVAIKIVRLDNKGQIELQALQVARKARHPHLITTHGAWQQNGFLFIAMELADHSLYDRLQEAIANGLPGIPRDELLGHMHDAAAGIDFLNQPDHATTGVQHRDIKPQNLLVISGRVKVGDFGIARIMQGPSTGHTGRLSLAYAAPEFFEGRTSHRSDQYSLAVSYYQLLTGQLPFTGSDVQVMKGHLQKEPDLLKLPSRDRAIVARAMSKSPQDRWPDCRTFVRALETSGKSAELNKTSKGVLRTMTFAWIGAALLAGVVMTLVIRGALQSIRNPKQVISSLAVIPPAETQDSAPAGKEGDFLANFPASIVTYEAVSGSTAGATDSGSPVHIRQRLDQQAYDQLATSLQRQLAAVARKSGTGTLGLTNFTDGIPLIVRYDLSSPALSDVIHEALETRKSSVVLVGRKLAHSAWSVGERHSSQRATSGNQIVSLDWYSLDDSAAEEVRLAFRRARTLAIEPVQSVGMATHPLSWSFPYKSSAERIREGTILSPGGPAGLIFSAGAGGGDLNLTDVRQHYEKSLDRQGLERQMLESERVLLLLPGFFVKGQFADAALVGTMEAANAGKIELRIHPPGQ